MKRTIPDQTTFADYVLHSKHMDRHDRPYRCRQPECTELEGFTYSGALLRHQRQVHGRLSGPKDQLWCTVSTCKRHSGRGFTRKENLDEHLRRVHGITTAGGVTSTGHQDSRPSTNKTSSISNVDAEREIKHVIERQDARDNAHWGIQHVWSCGTTGQRSAILNRMSPDSYHHPQHPARGNANLAAQTQSSPPRLRSTSQALTPAIRATTERPYTSDVQWLFQDSDHIPETSLHPPYPYANAPYIDHENQSYVDASFSAVSPEVQVQGPPPQVGQVGQMAPQDGSASPITNYSAPPPPQVDRFIQMGPLCGFVSPIEMISSSSSPSSSSSAMSTGVTQQNGRKRSHEDAFPRSPGQTAKSECSMRTLKVRELSARTIEHPVDSNDHEKSTENFSGVQALLLRWFEASAAAVVLGSFDG